MDYAAVTRGEAVPYEQELPCSALFNKDNITRITPPNVKTANDFISTSRIKEWRPADKSRASDDPKIKYCYMDYDRTNNNIDPLLDGKECSMNNNLFQAPFIKNVFEDRGYDATRKFPYNKCVIKLDTEVLEHGQNLSQFWDVVGANNCADSFADIQREVNDYYRRLKTCTMTNKDYKFKNEDFTRLQAQNADSIAKKETQSNNCWTHAQVLYGQLTQTEQDRDAKMAAYTSMSNTCSITQTKLAKDYQDCQTGLSVQNDLIVRKTAQLNQLIATYNSSNAAYQITRAAYSNMQVDYVRIVDHNNWYRKEIDRIQAATKDCQTQRSACETGYSNCMATQAALNKEIDNYRTYITDTRLAYNSCMGEQERLKKMVDFKQVMLQNIQNLYIECEREYNACVPKRKIEMEATPTLSNRINWLIDEISKCKKRSSDVTAYTEGLANARIQLEDVKASSRVISDNMAKIDAVKLDMAKDKAVACYTQQAAEAAEPVGFTAPSTANFADIDDWFNG